MGKLQLAGHLSNEEIVVPQKVDFNFLGKKKAKNKNSNTVDE